MNPFVRIGVSLIFTAAGVAIPAQASPYRVPAPNPGQSTLAPPETGWTGNPLALDRAAAAKRCAKRGGRLPTIRELVMALHPEGIIELASVGGPNIFPANHEAEVAFFYSSRHYPAPRVDGIYSYWSESSSGVGMAYVLDEWRGDIHLVDSEASETYYASKLIVRCWFDAEL